MRTTALPLTANVLAAHKSHLQTVRQLRFRMMIKCLEKPYNVLFFYKCHGNYICHQMICIL